MTPGQRERIQSALADLGYKPDKHYVWTLSGGLRVPCREKAEEMVRRLNKRRVPVSMEWTPELFESHPRCYVYVGWDYAKESSISPK